MSGKRKGKQKFRNAEEARKARELQELWEQNQKKWESLSKPTTKNVKVSKTKPVTISVPHGRATTQHIPSLDTNVKGAVSTRPSQQYTGTKMIGIGTMHKSNAVPVFSDEEAQSISTMRR